MAMIRVGEKIDTALQLKVFHQGETRTTSLGELLTRPTVVSVYMRNNTPGCDRQNDSLAAHADEFDRAGINLIAISRDTCGSHARYAAKKKITYWLASDPDDAFARATDSVVEKSMYGRKFSGPARAAYLLGRDGRVLAVTERVDPANHAAQVRELIGHLPPGTTKESG
jgi:peroxiredoxin Q/BCP